MDLPIGRSVAISTGRCFVGASEMFSIDIPIGSSVHISLFVVNRCAAGAIFFDIYSASQDFLVAKSLRIG